MSKYDDEATQYQNLDDEATLIENPTHEETNDGATIISNYDEVDAKAANDGIAKRAATGAASGLLVGGVSTFLMGMKQAPHSDDINNEAEEDDDNHKDVLSNPEWVDNDIAVATTVNDDMSFGEAFAAARADVGPGGCFEWRGNVYGTYTAEEWNHMTADERADWSDHFSWNHIDRSQSNVAQHSTTAQHNSSNATGGDDDIEVVSVNHIESNDVVHHQHNAHQVSNEVEVQSADPEIEILGVVHDNESNVNVAGMNIDGQDVILIDVDNDLTFDFVASDVNGNGQIDQNELVNIESQNLTVDALGGFLNPTGDLYAGNDAPDYSNDTFYEV